MADEDIVRAGGRSLDAIWLNSDLGPNECRFLEILARECNFKTGKFTEEKSYPDKRLYSYMRLSKRGFIDIRKRLVDSGFLQYRKAKDGFTYYRITEKLFDNFRTKIAAMQEQYPNLTYNQIRIKLMESIDCKSSKLPKRGKATAPKNCNMPESHDRGEATTPRGEGTAPPGEGTAPPGEGTAPILPITSVNPISPFALPCSKNRQQEETGKALPEGKEQFSDVDLTVTKAWFLKIEQRGIKPIRTNLRANAEALAQMRRKFGDQRVSRLIGWLLSEQTFAKVLIETRIQSLTKLDRVFEMAERQMQSDLEKAFDPSRVRPMALFR